MATESRTPPREICSVPVPTTAVAPAEWGAELKLAAAARFCTAIEYWPGHAVEAGGARVGSPQGPGSPRQRRRTRQAGQGRLKRRDRAVEGAPSRHLRIQRG